MGPTQEFNCATIRGACGTVSHEESGNEMEVNSIATMEEPFKDAIVVEDKQETMMTVHDDLKSRGLRLLRDSGAPKTAVIVRFTDELLCVSPKDAGGTRHLATKCRRK